jgi:cytoskeletal protein CcmA (bactofilin family)
MWQRENTEGKRDVETVIGSTVKVDGNFVGAGDVIVQGQVAGTLKTSKNLQVGPGATIKADVEAANILVAGEIRGHVTCRGKIEIAATGKVYGNVDTQSIVVAHGAVLHGKVTMAGHDAPAPVMKESKEKEPK